MSDLKFPETYKIIKARVQRLCGSTTAFAGVANRLNIPEPNKGALVTGAKFAQNLMIVAEQCFDRRISRTRLQDELSLMADQDFSIFTKTSPVPNAGDLLKKELRETAQMVIDAYAPLVDEAAKPIASFQHHTIMTLFLEQMSPWIDSQRAYNDPSHTLRAALGTVVLGHDVPLLGLIEGIHALEEFTQSRPARPTAKHKAAQDAAGSLLPLGEMVLRQALERVKVPAVA